MGCYVMVGLASRRILLHPTTDHMVAQVFRLQQPHGGETSIRVRQTELTLLLLLRHIDQQTALTTPLILLLILMYIFSVYS